MLILGEGSAPFLLLAGAGFPFLSFEPRDSHLHDGPDGLLAATAGFRGTPCIRPSIIFGELMIMMASS